MICQICNEREATIVLKRILNGVHSEIHMCESCAKKELFDVANKFNFSDVFSMFMPNGDAKTQSSIKTAPLDTAVSSELICPNCGTPFEMVQSMGLVGCEKCYDYFADALRGYTTQLHGKSVHTGKLARGSSTAQDSLRERSKVQSQLEAAIRDENYELAAEYRDLLKSLKKNSAEE